MIKVGITGGIGSGKSVVAALLSVMGVPVYIADKESKRLTSTSPEIRKKLLSLFGETVFSGSQLNKQVLAALIFSDKKNLEEVNRIIHPVVLQDFLHWTEQQTTPFVAMESAILFESGFNTFVDVILTVTAPIDVRIDRIQQRDGLTKEQILQRLANQWPEEEKLKRSDFVLCNDNEQALIPQVIQVLPALKKKFIS